MCVLVSLIGVALGAPVEFTTSGRVLDAAGGPVNGTVAAEFRIVGDEEGADVRWSEAVSLPVQDGYYSYVLGQDAAGNALDDSEIVAGSRWLDVRLDGVRARIEPLHPAPFSVVSMRTTGFAVATSEPPCDRVGGAYYDPSVGLRVCDGNDWQTIGAEAPIRRSCLEIRDNNESRGDGAYVIDPNGAPHGDAFTVWCDMTTAGGGWTLVSQMRPVNDAASTLCTTGAVNELDQHANTVTEPAKLADADINTIWGTGTTREVLARIVDDSSSSVVGAWDRACILDFTPSTAWNSSVSAPYPLSSLESPTFVCPTGALGDHTIDSATSGFCGPAYRELSSGTYLVWSINTSYTNTSGHPCVSPNAGRTWLGAPNAGCNVGQWLVR